MRRNPFAVTLLAGVMLAGCAANPITGRSQLMLVSEKSAIAESRQAYTQMLAPLSAKGKVNSDLKLKARVEAITYKLVAQAVRYRPESKDWDWQVSVIDDPKTVNAFCMAGGKMAIYTGLIEQTKATDDEIAQVMGHEIAHALVGHTAEKMSVAMASQVGAAVLAAMATTSERSQRGAEAGLGVAAMLAIQLPNSREAETEADRVGIEIAARAGYDPNAAVSLWKKMKEASGEKGRFDFLSTHPASEKRIEHLASLAPEMMPLYQAKEARPSFVPRPAANERVLDGPGKAPDYGSQLTLLSPEFERFKGGRAELTCIPCAFPFTAKRAELRHLYESKNWRELATKVMAINYRQDLSYFYLGAAAEQLGFLPAAEKYYRAADAVAAEGHRCRDQRCDGFDVARETSAALKRLQGLATR